MMSKRGERITFQDLLDEAKRAGFTAHPDEEIRQGDNYLAGRNVDIKLLTCKKVDVELGCIFPEEIAYAYNFSECVKVTLD